MQKTVKAPVKFRGVGLHTGKPATVVVHPASAEYGIWFRRVDVRGVDQMIPALWNYVPDARLCTKIENEDGVCVSTIEHMMAALVGCGVQNALIEIDGPEVPILDGSSAPFVEGILDRGLQNLDAPVRAYRVLKTIEVSHNGATARLVPAASMEMKFDIQFEDAAIGEQSKSLTMANGTFVRELCDSRTFCRKSEVDMMHAAGLALGGTYENAVVVDGEAILSPGGFRHADEPVRHKMLDALGDLALAGAPLIARYEGNRAGHALTNKLLRALFADPSALRMEVCDAQDAACLPGVGVKQADLRQVA